MSGDKRERRLSEDEAALWRGIARSVKPLRAAAKKLAERAAIQPPAKAKSAPKPAPKIVATVAAPRPVQKIAAAPGTLDRRTRQKLARGREAIDARLDLHGMTQAEAHGALLHFLQRVQGNGAKFVIVVTGKGARGLDGARGILRRQVPMWLGLPEFRALVVGFESAHVGHGGDGALYVRVRRGR